MKKGYKLTAALMTTAMMFAGMQVIHAAPPTTTGTEANPAQIKLRKGIEMPTGTSTPAGTLRQAIQETAQQTYPALRQSIRRAPIC